MRGGLSGTGVFSQVAGLSADATLQLAGFAGGMDSLVAKTRAFVDTYYSEAEKAGIQAAGIKATLDALVNSVNDMRIAFLAHVDGGQR